MDEPMEETVPANGTLQNHWDTQSLEMLKEHLLFQEREVEKILPRGEFVRWLRRRDDVIPPAARKLPGVEIDE